MRAAAAIARATFVCEYAGEILTADEASERRRDGDGGTVDNYILAALEVTRHGQPLRTIIDPTRRGNVGRYINHSCEPNLACVLVRVGSFVPRIAFFSKRDIASGEELTFHYGESSTLAGRGESLTTTSSSGGRSDRRPCLCGAPTCAGVLPFDTSAD